MAAMVRAGKISAHEAALLVGIRKPADALAQLHRWWHRASDEEKAAFLKEMKLEKIENQQGQT
jgi:hypothetical protein